MPGYEASSYVCSLQHATPEGGGVLRLRIGKTRAREETIEVKGKHEGRENTKEGKGAVG